MTVEQFERVKSNLVEVIEFWSERATTAAEVEALATVVWTLVIFLSVRTLEQGGQQAFG